MTPKDFETNLLAVIANKEEKDKNLMQEASRHWSEISTRRYIFNRGAQTSFRCVQHFTRLDCRVVDLEVAELRKLTLDDVVAFFRAHVAINSPTRRKLCVQIFGGKHKLPSTALPRDTWLDADVGESKEEAKADAAAAAAASAAFAAAGGDAGKPTTAEDMKELLASAVGGDEQVAEMIAAFAQMEPAQAGQAANGLADQLAKGLGAAFPADGKKALLELLLPKPKPSEDDKKPKELLRVPVNTNKIVYLRDSVDFKRNLPLYPNFC